MTPSILLLDCSGKLTEKLKYQGFDVDSGTIGFCNRIRHLPCQVYEKDILIYNPSFFASGGNGYIVVDDIQVVTPEYSLTHLRNHILRGATLLIFINHVAVDLRKQNEAYSWIPFMPEIFSTKDLQPIVAIIGDDSYCNFLTPIVSKVDLKTPGLQKIGQPDPYFGGTNVDLFLNRNDEVLGCFLIRGKGKLIILPEYQFNEEIINTFLHRVIPKLYNLETRINLIDQFLSPGEIVALEGIKKIEENRKELNETLGITKGKLTSAKLNKIQTIKKDETAILILNYYDLATQQDDVALFYLYKVIEALEKKYNGEKKARSTLGCNTEWNLIGKAANTSYADIRHAPKPGEKIKEWSQEEIKECFSATEKIINSYLSTLFQGLG